MRLAPPFFFEFSSSLPRQLVEHLQFLPFLLQLRFGVLLAAGKAVCFDILIISSQK